ncbi:MAG: hypothetical protein IT184_18965 [Acidobacteria bacterium]|nr:hypothetical protein [Acidobacteriota bacterium]
MRLPFRTRRSLAVLAATAAAAAGGLIWHLSHRAVVPDPGVPLALARDRAARVRDLRYAVSLHLPASLADPVTGRVTISFTLSDASSALALDFRQPASHLRRVVARNRDVAVSPVNGHIVLPASALEVGRNTIDLEFVAGDEALNRHDEYLYTLFVPARASFALPCFDQPNLKARWSVTLDMPHDWVAVANAAESTRAPAAGGRTSVQFAETEPLPTYLVAFAAGRFAVESSDRHGRPIRLFHRETDRSRIARNREALIDLQAQALAWLESYTGIPYPFGKLDVVLLPAFQFSGMEHPGALYYNAGSLLLDPSATQNQLLNRASLIAHETAHMWFGNLVTISWFDDVWLKEVFANLMAAKIVSPAFPDVNHDLRFLYQHVPAAYDVDRTAGANPVRQPLDNLDEAGTLYGAIIYQKAPVAMRQLELAVGEDLFRDALREYLEAHRYGNADWPDLVDRLDRRTTLDLRAWSRAWIEQPGRPTIRTELATERGAIARLAFVQDDARGRALVWPERARVVLQAGRAVHTFDVMLEERETTIAQAVGLPAPAWVLPVGRGAEYGFFDLDAATLAYLTRRLPEIRDPLVRGAALVALWEAMLENRVEPEQVFRLLADSVASEPDELNVQHMLERVRELFWRFTGPDARQEAAAQLEPVLRRGLAAATRPSLKGAWLAAFRSIALSEAGVSWLEQLWRHDASIPGLPLTEVDETDLALELALRDVEHAAEILAAQRDRIANPDRRARFEFLLPAVSADPAIREGFFTALTRAEGRRQESWTIDGMRYLHHPLRASSSRRLIRPALALLPELQRTGDIFFPKRWADATLGGYQSVQTAADVRRFVDELPQDYPARLRWILLSAADPLFRAARFQQQ